MRRLMERERKEQDNELKNFQRKLRIHTDFLRIFAADNSM
jgi:hypothetical protein